MTDKKERNKATKEMFALEVYKQCPFYLKALLRQELADIMEDETVNTSEQAIGRLIDSQPYRIAE